MFSKIFIYYTYIYVYKAFLLHLMKAWERTYKKRDREIGQHKLNGMGALNIK